MPIRPKIIESRKTNGINESCRGRRPVRRSEPSCGQPYDWGRDGAPACCDHPRSPRVVPVPRRRRACRLRRQGQVAAQSHRQLLRRAGAAEPPHRPADVRRGVAGVDHRRHRGGRADVGVQPHPAPPAALQRALPRRQELPVPVRHAGGRVAPGDGRPRCQAQGEPLFRPVRTRLRHPRDPRPAAAHVPDPHLLGQQVRRPSAPR